MLLVFATCCGMDMWGVCGGKFAVMAVSSLSVIHAKWSCTYETKNYTDDMMGDPGVTQSHYHHAQSS